MSPSVWFVLGMFFIILEVALIPGVGFLFVGLSAIFLGGLISADFLHDPVLSTQVVYFFLLSIVWWVVLWKPMKRLTKNKAGEGYHNLVGTYGTVEEEGGLAAGKIGNIKWSGAIVRARIRPESVARTINNGETVWVYEQKDGVMLVDITKPEHK